MKPLFAQYTEGFALSGDLQQDIQRFFALNDDPGTLQHTLEVAAEAERLAILFGIDPSKPVRAALLHDISNVIPVSSMLEVAEALSIAIMNEERRYGRSVHQKLSRLMAATIFGVNDQEVLSAIESHTTHKPGAAMTDKLLFVADKISWNLPGEHPYLREMRAKVEQLELDDAILIYLNHIWDQRGKLKLVHPWLIEAREELLQAK